MDKIKVTGGKPLKGSAVISGSKNAALPIMTASILTEDDLELSNIPYLVDVTTMNKLLLQHGVELCVNGNEIKDNEIGNSIIFNGSKINNYVAPYDIVRKMRASVIVLGPLLARFGHAKVSLPGGCAIGSRPVDLHLKGLEALGANICIDNGYIIADAPNGLTGSEIEFAKVSVGATENIMMAATLASGTTIIKNAAREPEIVDLAKCLKSMGAEIKGEGTDTMTIVGKRKLHGASHRVIADRIEAGTFAAMCGAAGGNILLENIDASIFEHVAEYFKMAGVSIKQTSDGVLIEREKDRLEPIDIETCPYPGFPTDMQAQFMAMLLTAKGNSTIKESIFENRFMHVPELNRMGADISLNGSIANIKGVEKLYGAEVMATDLRASVSLIIAALSTDTETTVNRVYHIDRGYEFIEQKLSKLGVNISRV